MSRRSNEQAYRAANLNPEPLRAHPPSAVGVTIHHTMHLTFPSPSVLIRELSQNPSVVRTADGDLLLLQANYADAMAGCCERLHRSTDDGATWSQAERTFVCDEHLGGLEGTISCAGDVVLVAAIEGSDIKRQPRNPKRCRLRRSTDGGHTWSAPFDLGDRHGGVMPYGKMIRLRASGRLLLPTYACENWLDRGGSRTFGVIFASDDEGATWTELGILRQDASVRDLRLLELAIVELADGRLLAVTRGDAVTAEAFPYGLRAESEDGGRTWTPATPININICEPRPTLTPDGRILLAARCWPGNVYSYYRPLEPHEREPGTNQTETVATGLRDEFLSPVRDFGVAFFTTNDDGRTWQPQLTVNGPAGGPLPEDADLITRHRYQAAYPDVAWLDDQRLFCVYRQPDPALPDLRPGLTYSHIYQRYVMGGVVRVGEGA